MSGLHQAVNDYIALKRALGYKPERELRLLADFAAYIEREGSSCITTLLALAWATQPADAAHSWWSARLDLVRRFAGYVRTLDPKTEIPSRDLLPHRRQRLAAYLYSNEDVQALLAAARRLPGRLKGCTYATLLGLLAATGMRVGEAIAIDRSDLQWCEGLLTIRKSKFGKSREVALHDTTQQALQAYARRRDRVFPRPKNPSFFVSQAGTRLFYSNVHLVFLRLVRRAGLADGHPRRPRIHDLRHTFAVRTLQDWYRRGSDVDARLPLLSTYLGHVNPSSTYWYLTSAPELVGLAAERLERAMGDLP